MIMLVLATRNGHKVAEIRAILSERWHYLTLVDIRGAPTVREDAGTFAGNATKKAVEIAHWLAASPQLQGASHADEMTVAALTFVVADDSGLEVDALNGAPGVHSARFAALDSSAPGNSPDAANNAKLLRLLEGVPPDGRTARFRCLIALTPAFEPSDRTASPVCSADEAEMQTQLFEGICEGAIAEAPSGSGGFGYDPLFIPNGFQQSFGSLGEAVKNRISHRGRALSKVRQFLADLSEQKKTAGGQQSDK